MNNSIIIVTLNRADCVRTCLDCLTRQTRSANQIIVVDASPDDLTRKVVAGYTNVQYLRNDNGFGRMTESRNIGLFASTGQVIAFLDDDAFAHSTWLEHLLQSYSDDTIGAVGGRALNGQCGEETEGIDRIGKLGCDGMLWGFFAADPGHVIDVDHIMGCNMSFRREVLAQLGGFRTDYPGISGLREDSDICLRVRKLGFRIVFNPSAAVDHVGAPQAKGRRFDWRYAYYAKRNHAVMLIRNFGFFSNIFWRNTVSTLIVCLREFLIKVGSAVLHLLVSALGLVAGVVSGLRLVAKTGHDPVRRDEKGNAIRDSLLQNLHSDCNQRDKK